MSAPRVTVMMVTHNAERFLREAVESVLRQTFEDFELLILDDGSSDRSLEIVRSWADPRIRIVSNDTNRGVRYSRHKALCLAWGEYAAVLDADDVALPTRLERQVAFLDAHPDVALVGSAYEVIDEAGRSQGICRHPTSPLVVRWSMLFGGCFGHSTVTFRREEALAVGGYDATLRAGEDHDLYVRLAARHQLANLAEPLVRWRSVGTSLSHNRSAAMNEQFAWTVARSVRLQAGLEIDFATAQCLFRDLPPRGVSREVVARAYGTVERCLAIFLRSARGEDETRELILLAMEDLDRLAASNPATRVYGLSRLLACLGRLGFPGALDRRAIRSLARTLAVPGPVRSAIGRVVWANASARGMDCRPNG